MEILLMKRAMMSQNRAKMCIFCDRKGTFRKSLLQKGFLIQNRAQKGKRAIRARLALLYNSFSWRTSKIFFSRFPLAPPPDHEWSSPQSQQYELSDLFFCITVPLIFHKTLRDFFFPNLKQQTISNYQPHSFSEVGR